jgi:hypothetical protein
VFFFLHALLKKWIVARDGEWKIMHGWVWQIIALISKMQTVLTKKQKGSWVECLTCMSEPVFVNVFGAQESIVLTKKQKGSWDKCLTCMPEPVFLNVFGAQESIPRNRFLQAVNRFLGSLKGLQIRALELGFLMGPFDKKNTWNDFCFISLFAVKL